MTCHVLPAVTLLVWCQTARNRSSIIVWDKLLFDNLLYKVQPATAFMNADCLSSTCSSRCGTPTTLETKYHWSTGFWLIISCVDPLTLLFYWCGHKQKAIVTQRKAPLLNACNNHVGQTRKHLRVLYSHLQQHCAQILQCLWSTKQEMFYFIHFIYLFFLGRHWIGHNDPWGELKNIFCFGAIYIYVM